MRNRTGIHNIFLVFLPQAAFCALMFCTGCLPHRISIPDAYRLDDKGGVPMLVPIASDGVNLTEFQTATISFPAGPSQAKTAVR
jgi:hypothetical protein